MDKKQKTTDTVKSNIQHQEKAPETSAVGTPAPQERDLKKVLKPEVLNL